MAEKMYIFGRHPVAEYLEMGQSAKALLVQDSAQKSLRASMDMAQAAGISVQQVSKRQLDRATKGANHQGLILELGEFQYTALTDLLERAQQQSKTPCIVALDGIQDPHNLGSVIRAAAAFGAQGVVIPDRRAAQVTGTVFKTSAGAVARLPVAQVKNFRQALDSAKEQGFWVIGTVVTGGSPLSAIDFCRPVILVIGSENKGLRDLSTKTCDVLATIDLAGGMESLNAAVAGALCLYECRRQRAS